MKLPVQEKEQCREVVKPEFMRQGHVPLDVDLVEGNIAMRSRIIGQQPLPVPARCASRGLKQHQRRAMCTSNAVMEIKLVQCRYGVHCTGSITQRRHWLVARQLQEIRPLG